MSVKMAVDLTKPLDFIASGVFSEKGPAFRKLFPMMSLLCLGVKCVLVCERSPIPPHPLCRDIVMEFSFMRAIWMYMCPLAVTHSSSWFGIAHVFVNGGNHLPLLLPWHLHTCTSKNQKEEGQRRSRVMVNHYLPPSPPPPPILCPLC